MEIVCDTSFLMVLCYEPVKNLEALESKFGKLIWLIHPKTVDELTQLEKTAGIKRSKIANLCLKIIKNQIDSGDFRYIEKDELNQFENNVTNLSVDSVLLNLSSQKKRPLATIDKGLIRRALKKGVDIITLKNNKIIYVHSKLGSNLNHP
jgi:rRNA-processing protein FCF1